MEDVTVTTRGTQDMPFSGTMRTEPSSLGGEGLHHQWIPEPTSMDSQREFEKLKERGLYRAGGLEPPKKSEVESPIQVVKEVSPVVEERIIYKQVHEIIPEVLREHEVSEIRHAVLPIHERVDKERTYSEYRLDQVRSVDLVGEMSTEEFEKNRRIIDEISRVKREELPMEHLYHYHNPVVHEVVKPRIIHEVHPIIKREIEKEHVSREILPVYEKVVDAARISDDVEFLRSMTKEEWERSKISGKGPEERYTSYWYRSPPHSPAKEGAARAYASPEATPQKETRQSFYRTEGGQRFYQPTEFKVLEPGYIAKPYGEHMYETGTLHREGTTHGATHIVHPEGHEADRLHRLSPVRGFTSTKTTH